MFESMAALLVLPGREDLTSCIITALDYNIGPKESGGLGQSRALLKQALRAPSPAVRFHATRHLLVLLRSGVNGFSSWGIKRLAKQIGNKTPLNRGTAIAPFCVYFMRKISTSFMPFK